jgi:predicted hydrocarbon binding protein
MLNMDESDSDVRPSTNPPSPPTVVYPLKELADRIRIPNVKASFDLVKGLSSMVADGKIIEKMTGFRIIVFPAIFTLNIWSSFQEVLGKKLAPKVITSFHRDTGKLMVEVGRRNFKLEDKFAFEFYFWLLSAIGWGEVKKFELDDQKIEGTWQMDYKGPLPRNALKDVPFHDNWRGEVMAAAQEAFHVSIDVEETKCAALGDSYCEFKWRKSETQDKELASISNGVFNEAPKSPPTTTDLVLKKDFKDAFNRTAMPEEGKMVDGDMIVAVKDARSIIGLTYRASELLGEGTVRAVLVRAGSLFASDDAKRFAIRGKQLVEDYLKWMSVTGWGMFHVVNLDENGGRIECERSVFAEEYPRGKRPVCYFVIGILSSLMEAAFNHKYMVKEERCIAKSDDKCSFEMRMIPR